MKKMILDLDMKKCCACGACAVACMDQHDYDPACGNAPFRTIFEIEQKNNSKALFSHYSVACMHCSPAPCITACPVGCIYKDPETDLTVFDSSDCIGCHSCAMACPFGAPSFTASGKMEKCDGCYQRIQYGMEPACVKVCMMDALRMVSEDEYIKTNISTSITPLAKKIADKQI